MKAQAGAALLPERHGIFASPVNVSAENLNLLEPVPPNWLDLGESYVRALIAEAGNLQGAELKTWFKNELRERLRFLSTAPKWVQSPCWPLRDGVPLVFLGQLSAGGLLHDDSQVYVFMHPASAEIVTLVQSA